MKKVLPIFLVLFGLIFSQMIFSQNCNSPSAQTTLDINNVSVGLLNGGDSFWDLSDSHYEYPKGSGKNVLFAGALWMGGIDALGQLHVAAQTYRQSGSDFFPGPINDDGTLTTTNETCANFDRFWQVLGSDVEDFKTAFEVSEGSIDIAEIPESILKWPGRNNPHFTDFDLPIDQDLAPFWDLNNDAEYNALDGDFPVIDSDNSEYADQMIWWIYNDVGNTHGESGGEKIGMEVKVMAYAYETEDYLNNTTFYQNTITYYGSSSIYDFYLGLMIDPDLGGFDDDYIGCDTIQNMGYAYNGDSEDSQYGSDSPLVGVKFLSGFNQNVGEEISMSSFLSYNNDFTVTGNPETVNHYYSYLKAEWKDGSPVTFGDNGYGGTIPTNFAYPGNPSDPNAWSECSEGNNPADRRFVMGIGPTDIEPGTSQKISYAVLIVPGEDIEDSCPSIEPLLEMGSLVDDEYYNKFVAETPEPWATGVEDIPNLIQAKIYPNPASTYVYFDWDNTIHSKVILNIFDVNGKIIEQVNSSNQQEKINLANWAAGLYYYEFMNRDGQTLNCGKFLVE